MENTVYITFFDDITLQKVQSFIHHTQNIIAQYNPTGLYFLIASSGGDVDAGFVLYNYLISLSERLDITMHNTGMIDSIANVIFCAGKKRYAAPSTSFLFHGVAMNFPAVAQNRAMIKETLSRLSVMEARISETVCRHSKLTEAELKVLYDQGESRDLTFALEKGLIDEIKVPVVPQGSVHLSLTV